MLLFAGCQNFTALRVIQRLGGGGDTTIPYPGMAPKEPLPGIGLNDPLHDPQACPEFYSFYQGVGKKSPPEEQFSCRPFPKRDKTVTPPPPPIVERLLNSLHYSIRSRVEVNFVDVCGCDTRRAGLPGIAAGSPAGTVFTKTSSIQSMYPYLCTAVLGYRTLPSR